MNLYDYKLAFSYHTKKPTHTYNLIPQQNLNFRPTGLIDTITIKYHGQILAKLNHYKQNYYLIISQNINDDSALLDNFVLLLPETKSLNTSLAAFLIKFLPPNSNIKNILLKYYPYAPHTPIHLHKNFNYI